MELLGFILDVVGKVMVAYTAIAVHLFLLWHISRFYCINAGRIAPARVVLQPHEHSPLHYHG